MTNAKGEAASNTSGAQGGFNSGDGKIPRVYRKRPVTMVRAVCYGLTDFMGGGWNTIISAYLLFFLVTFTGLSAVQAGSILLIARFTDAVASLLIGSITDNFYKTKLGKRFGRRHFFLIIGAPAIAIFYPLLWIVVPGSYWYYLIIYLLIELVIAIVLIPWETLPTEMTTNYIDRTKLSSARMFISAGGTFFVTMLPTVFLNIFGEDKPTGYTITAIVFGIICAIIITVSNVMTWELTPEEAAMRAKSEEGEDVQEKETISSYLASYVSTFKNKSFRKHIIIYLCSFTGKDVFATSLLFYVVSVLGLKQADGQAALSLSFIAIFVTVAAGFIMAYKGPKVLYTISYSIILAVLVGFFLLSRFEPGSHAATITILFILGGLYQVGRGILEFTPWNVFPFIPDIDKMITSKSRAGIYAAVMTFLRKSTGAVATMLVAWILDMGGYDASADVQTAGAQSTITYVFVFGAGALILAALIVSRTFNLNAKTHAVVAAEIKRLESGGSKTDVTEGTRKVVEDLTGYPYSKLWGAG